MLRARVTAAAALGLAALACGPSEPPRSLLLVSIDTIRTDRIGCYGREAAGTPRLDALAARGARFADAMAPSPITLPSHATLLTGRDPLGHGIRHNGLFALPETATTLAERLGESGFRSAGFVASIALAPRHGLAQGFERYTGPGREGRARLFHLGERPAEAVNRDALAWLDTLEPAERFFLFVHYMEPHAPYAPPEPERSRFAGDPYQGEVARADRALGELLDALEARGRLAQTLVLVVGDHGEALGDHGELSHGIFLYQSTLRVPFIAAGPGVRAGRVIETPVGLIDVVPTALEALGVGTGPDGNPTAGTSLWPTLRGGPAPGVRDLYAESFVPRYDNGWSELRALRRGRYKFVLAPRSELYDLERDPGESLDLAPARPPELARLRAALAQRVKQAGAVPDRLRVPLEDQRALEALGYGSGAFEGVEGAKLVDPKDRIAEAAALDHASRLLRNGKTAQGEKLLRSLVARSPDSPEPRIRLIVALLVQEKREEAAEQARELVRIAALLPHGDRIAARAHLVLGEIHLEDGRLEEAAREYELAIAAPQPPRVYHRLAAIHHDVGRREEALRVLALLEARGDADERTRELRLYLEGRGPAPASSDSPPSGNR